MKMKKPTTLNNSKHTAAQTIKAQTTRKAPKQTAKATQVYNEETSFNPSSYESFEDSVSSSKSSSQQSFDAELQALKASEFSPTKLDPIPYDAAKNYYSAHWELYLANEEKI